MSLDNSCEFPRCGDHDDHDSLRNASGITKQESIKNDGTKKLAWYKKQNVEQLMCIDFNIDFNIDLR